MQVETVRPLRLGFHRFAAPPEFYRLAGRLIPWFGFAAAALAAFGLYLGFFVAPTDFQQGEVYRLIFIHDPRRADRAAGVLALAGVVNLPIIYFSVQWWNTLHQGATISPARAPSMAATMLEAMLVMVVAFWMYSIAASLARARAILLER